MVKENKLLIAVKAKDLPNVIKALEKIAKQKSSKAKAKKLDLEARDGYGLTAVHHAARNGTLEILEALLKHGGLYEVYDLHGLRPISYACAEGHKKIVETLLHWGSSSNRSNNNEFLTPLHLASMYGYAEIVMILLQYKADHLALNRDRQTALDIACAYGKYNVINVLVAHSAASNKNQQVLRMANNNMIYAPMFNQCLPQNMLANPSIAMATTPQHAYQPFHYNPNQNMIPNSSSSIISTTSSNNSNHSNNSGRNSSNSSSRHSNFGNNPSPIGYYGNAANYQDIGGSMSIPAPTNFRSNARPILSSQNSNCSSSGRFSSDDKNIEETITELPDDEVDDNTNQQSAECIPPTLDDSEEVMMKVINERQNLKEACFAVQARAISTFYNQTKSKSYAIRFTAGDLITVLKRYHNGLSKGYVTSEGILSTGLFPEHSVEYLTQTTPTIPPVCCDKPIQIYCIRPTQLMIPEVYGVQSPETTPIVGARKYTGNSEFASGRPQFAGVKNEDDAAINENSGVKGPTQSDEESDRHSPIEIPPQMTNLFSSKIASNSQNQKSSSPHPLPMPYLQQPHTEGAQSLSTSGLTMTNPSSSSSAASSSSSGSNNKRNSVASLDSGRGSAADNKSVVSNSRPPHQLTNQQALSNMPNQAKQSQIPSNSNNLPGNMSLDSLYHQCSLISLNNDHHSNIQNEENALVSWLHYIGMGHYSETLYRAGYDIATLSKATPEDLNACGVTSPYDRQFLKAQLARLSVPDALPELIPKSMTELLTGLKMSHYEQLLANQNFTQVDHLLGLSWEDLADLGIEKLGHQKKLSLAIDRISRLMSSSINNQSKSSSTNAVTQSKSYEELPYPTAIMNQYYPSQQPYYYGSTPRNVIQHAHQPQQSIHYGAAHHNPHQSVLSSSHSDDSVVSSSCGMNQLPTQFATPLHHPKSINQFAQQYYNSTLNNPLSMLNPYNTNTSNTQTNSINTINSQDDTHISCIDNQLPRLLPTPSLSLGDSHFDLDTNTGTVRVRRAAPLNSTSMIGDTISNHTNSSSISCDNNNTGEDMTINSNCIQRIMTSNPEYQAASTDN